MWTVSMDPGETAGVPVDWWALACHRTWRVDEWYHYDVARDAWETGIAVSRQGPCDVLGRQEILNSQGLPQGDHTFYFGVDPQDGLLDPKKAAFDTLGLTVLSWSPL